MTPFVVKQVARFKGEICLPGDKSIAHRALIVAALSRGKTDIINFPLNQDCLVTLCALRTLGITISQNKDHLTVMGKGLRGLKKPLGSIYVGDSGTSLRLILGMLAGQHFTARLLAGTSLSKRPMLRVTKPLRLMGARIKARIDKAASEEFAPLTVTGSRLEAITYEMPVPSAQVKSSLLLAGLNAKGRTVVVEPIPTRDHTERMLKLFKADIKLHTNTIIITGGRPLTSPQRISIPGDISSAAFFMALGVIAAKSSIVIRAVSLNPTRMGAVQLLKRMGAKIGIRNQKGRGETGEPVADIFIKNSRLWGVTVKKEEIPAMIDELPVLMVAASLAKGVTVFEGLNELRVKETDRINSMVTNLRKMGGRIAVSRAGGVEKVMIRGVKRLKGARVRSFQDHRTAMSMVVAGLSASGLTRIDDVSCINKSFPEFLEVLNSLI